MKDQDRRPTIGSVIKDFLKHPLSVRREPSQEGQVWAGRASRVHYTYRTPFETLTLGVLPGQQQTLEVRQSILPGGTFLVSGVDAVIDPVVQGKEDSAARVAKGVQILNVRETVSGEELVPVKWPRRRTITATQFSK